MKRIGMSLLVWAMLMALAANGHAQDPTLQELYRAKTLVAPTWEKELGRDVLHRTWDFSQPDRGNFTSFSVDVKDLQVTPEKTLRFRADANKVTLGWGNYLGQQPYAKRVYLWPQQMNDGSSVVLKVKQSAPESTWAVSFWSDGQRLRGQRGRGGQVTVKLEGTDWKELKFGHAFPVPPDGFDVVIEGPQDNIIEIGALKFTRPLSEGYSRKEFDLPPGRIWRAVAEVFKFGWLYVNGKEVDIENSILRRPRWGGEMYQTTPVDLAPYLKPGKNCIAMYIKLIGSGSGPAMYLQSQVVMTSGEIVRLDTDDTWQVSPQAQPGWNQVGFNADGWEKAKVRSLNYFYSADTIPAYDGRLIIESPDEEKLFFLAGKPIVLRVRAPEGLAAQQPTLSWMIERVEYDNSEEQSRGEVQKFRKADGSLIYEINAGRLERGVYTVALTLRSGQEVIEERYREPLMVIGKIPMKEVEGTSFEDGMKLTLEDTIDFTNPKDPHPWVETVLGSGGKPAPPITTPHIVRKEGLVYRETQPQRSAMFSYRMQFQRPDSFYLMVLEYPNDAERWIGVSCASPLHWCSKVGPAIWTGDKYPLTNTMQELRWIFRPGPPPHTIDIVSIQQDSSAAAARLRIYRIEELPALKINDSGQRWLGILTERTMFESGFPRAFGLKRETPKGPEWQDAYKHTPIPGRLRHLWNTWDACEHYARYLRFTGQNLHVMGCVQYDELNTPFTPRSPLPTSRLPAYGLGGSAPQDVRDVAVRVFGQNGIDVIASVEYWGHRSMAEEFAISDAQLAHGADTARMVGRNGKQYQGYGWNHLHPRVEQLMFMITDDLTDTFKDQPNFLGVNWTPYLTGGFTMPSYLTEEGETGLFYSYDDVTVARFEKDTKIRVPVDPKDPQRFQKRYTFLTSPAIKEKWTEWRCQKIREFFLKTRDRMRAKRRDLNLFISLYYNWHHVKEWGEDGKPLQEFTREWAYDPSLYRDDEGLWFNRWAHATIHYAPAYHAPGYAAGWYQNVGKEYLDLYTRKNRRAVMIQHHWDENSYRPQGTVPEEWPVQSVKGRFHAQPNAENAREPFTQALIGSDPQMVMFGFMDVNLMVGHEQQMREFAQVLRALPSEQFSPVLGTGFQTNLAIRDLRKGGAYYFYVANPGYWPIRGSIALTGASRVIDLAANRQIEAKQEVGKTVVRVDLKPFGVAAYRVEGTGARVVSWQTEPLGAKDLAHVRGIVQKAEGLSGQRKALMSLLPEELTFMQQAVAQAKADLASGKYAEPWSIVTNWRFWILLHEQMEKAAQFGASFTPEEKPLDAAEPRILKVAWAKQAPKIDGKLDDPLWNQAKPVTGFLTADKRLSMVATRVRIAYDAKNLYVAAECADADPASIQRTAKSEPDVFGTSDDAIALFLQPNPQQPIYYQMAVTAGAVKFDQQVIGGTRDYDFAPPWEAATSATKDRWIAEIMIPLSSLAATAGAGKVWRGNFFRRFRRDLISSSYWSWVPRSAHDTNRFGELRFLAAQ